MKRGVLVFLLLIVASSAEEVPIRRSSRRGEAAGYSSRDATVLSMMGWGLGLTVGIAAFFSLMDNNATSSGSSGGDSGGGGGSGGHTHGH